MLFFMEQNITSQLTKPCLSSPSSCENLSTDVDAKGEVNIFLLFESGTEKQKQVVKWLGWQNFWPVAEWPEFSLG